MSLWALYDRIGQLEQAYKSVRDITAMDTTGASPVLKPTTHYASGGAQVQKGDLLYIIGGRRASDVTNVCFAYDISTRIANQIASLPKAREGTLAGLCAGGDKIYSVSGQTSSGGQQEIYEYTIATNTWGQVGTSTENLQSQFGAAATTTAGFKFFGTSTKSYNPTTRTWSDKANIPIEIHKMGTVVDSNRYIYLVGGDTKLYSGGTPMNTLYRYDTALNSWTARATMPRAQMNTVACVHGGYIWAFDASEYNTYRMIRYSISANNWATRGTAPNTTDYRIPGFMFGYKDFIYGIPNDTKPGWMFSTTGIWVYSVKPFSYSYIGDIILLFEGAAKRGDQLIGVNTEVKISQSGLLEVITPLKGYIRRG